MSSFSKYSQNNNFSLTLRNSLIFTLYNKNKQNFFKINNTIKTYYKDPILNDYIYLACNGLKKNVSFRPQEITNLNKSFVSYFENIDDNFLISNVYSNKYFDETIKKVFNKQKQLEVWKKKTKKSFILNVSQNLFVRNSYKNLYFLNNFGFFSKLKKKAIQYKLFSGLFYIFPKHIKQYFKNLFSLKYLLLNFYGNLQINFLNKELVKQNIILYTLFSQYLQYNIKKHLLENKLKFRKTNWFLRKFFYKYFKPLKSLIQFFFLFNVTSIKSNNFNASINNFLYFNNIFTKQVSLSILSNVIKNWTFVKKLTFLKQLFLEINLNFFKNSTSNFLPINFFYQYLLNKFINYENNFINFNIGLLKFNFINFLNLLSTQIQRNKLNQYLVELSICKTFWYTQLKYFKVLLIQLFITKILKKLRLKKFFFINNIRTLYYPVFKQVKYIKKYKFKIKKLKRRLFKKIKKNRLLFFSKLRKWQNLKKRKLKNLKYKKLYILNKNSTI